MENKPNYVLAGAFVLVLGAAFVWGVLWISAGGTPKVHDRYVAYMLESVSGLNVDSPLKYRGMDVGKVESIGIDADDPRRIRLVLQVARNVPITEGTVATLEYQGLTGIANINLIGGRAGTAAIIQPPGEEFPVIPTEPSLFARLDATTNDLLANLTRTSASLNALLDDANRAHIAASLENLARLTGHLADQSTRFDSLLDSLDTTLTNSARASESLPDLSRDLAGAASGVRAAALEFEKVAGHALRISADIEHLVGLSAGDLTRLTANSAPTMAAMLEELRLAAQNLRSMSESLAADPSVLLYGTAPAEPGPGELRE